MLLIGSRAMMFRAPEVLGRKPKDYDFIGYEDEIWDWCKKHNIEDAKKEGNKIISETNLCEFEIIQPESSSQLLNDFVESDSKTIKTDFGLVPNFNLLFTLKTSHRYLKDSPHFWKTAIDYHRMKDAGAKILPEYLPILRLRESETYKNKLPKLNVKKAEFFNEKDGVNYIYEHDDIHKAVALNDKPAYVYYLKDREEVQTDKNKFFACSRHIQLSGVVEEAATLAIERSLVPFPGVMAPKQAWLFALSKVCTSITSGYFREFAYENIFDVIKMYPEDYFDKFQEGIKNGRVRIIVK